MYRNHYNFISMSGTLAEEPVLSHESHGEKIYVFPLIIRRLSGKDDILRTYLRSSFIPVNPLKKGDRLTFEGEIRSFNNRGDVGSRLLISVFIRRILPTIDDDLNSCFLTGAICRQPIFRRTPLGREICDFMLAVNRRYQKSDYIPIIAWGHNAHLLSQTPVGTDINLEGRLQSRTYLKLSPEGHQERTAYEFSVSTIYEDDFPEFTGSSIWPIENTMDAEEIPPDA